MGKEILEQQENSLGARIGAVLEKGEFLDQDMGDSKQKIEEKEHAETEKTKGPFVYESTGDDSGPLLYNKLEKNCCPEGSIYAENARIKGTLRNVSLKIQSGEIQLEERDQIVVCEKGVFIRQTRKKKGPIFDPLRKTKINEGESQDTYTFYSGDGSAILIMNMAPGGDVTDQDHLLQVYRQAAHEYATYILGTNFDVYYNGKEESQPRGKNYTPYLVAGFKWYNLTHNKKYREKHKDRQIPNPDQFVIITGKDMVDLPIHKEVIKDIYLASKKTGTDFFVNLGIIANETRYGYKYQQFDIGGMGLSMNNELRNGSNELTSGWNASFGYHRPLLFSYLQEKGLITLSNKNHHTYSSIRMPDKEASDATVNYIMQLDFDHMADLRRDYTAKVDEAYAAREKQHRDGGHMPFSYEFQMFSKITNNYQNLNKLNPGKKDPDNNTAMNAYASFFRTYQPLLTYFQELGG